MADLSCDPLYLIITISFFVLKISAKFSLYSRINRYKGFSEGT
jgi:hypothetical protein